MIPTDEQQREDAVRRIQRAWRSFTNSRIFRYFRDLISFHDRGDPRELLRIINPAESSFLADASTAGVVRFRLGGDTFPPMIYYKIFVSAPVQDIGAFAPRDYTKEKMPTPGQLHTVGVDQPVPTHHKKEGWYRRVENNGWRPVVHRGVGGEDFVSMSTSMQEKPNWHFSRLQRQQDQQAKRKQRRVEWLQKMYSQGAAEEKLAAAGLLGTTKEEKDRTKMIIGKQAEECTADEEELLLSWATNLPVNFDEYYDSWVSLASSGHVGPGQGVMSIGLKPENLSPSGSGAGIPTGGAWNSAADSRVVSTPSAQNPGAGL